MEDILELQNEIITIQKLLERCTDGTDLHQSLTVRLKILEKQMNELTSADCSGGLRLLHD